MNLIMEVIDGVIPGITITAKDEAQGTNLLYSNGYRILIFDSSIFHGHVTAIIVYMFDFINSAYEYVRSKEL